MHFHWIVCMIGITAHWATTDGQRVINIQPQTLLTSGGQVITLSGSDLDNIPENISLTFTFNNINSTTNFTSDPCLNATSKYTLLCPVPVPMPLPPEVVLPSDGGQLLANGTHGDTQLTVRAGDISAEFPILLYTPPVIFSDSSRTFTLWTTSTVMIQGENLNLDGNFGVENYQVLLGNSSSCLITNVTSEFIMCMLPEFPPEINVELDLRIVVGAFEYVDRTIRYRVPYFPEVTRVFTNDPDVNFPVVVHGGQNLLVGVKAEDYDVQIGQGRATGLTLTPTSIRFFPPKEAPLPSPNFPLHPEGYPQVVVSVPTQKLRDDNETRGNETRFFYFYEYHVGYVRYLNSITMANGSPGSNGQDGGIGASNATFNGTGFRGFEVRPTQQGGDFGVLIALFVVIAATLLAMIVSVLLCGGVCRRMRNGYSNKTVTSETSLRRRPSRRRAEQGDRPREFNRYGSPWWWQFIYR